jgi:hypothetical protein
MRVDRVGDEQHHAVERQAEPELKQRQQSQQWKRPN